MTLTFWPVHVDWLLRHHTWEWCSPCIYIIHGTFLVMHNRPELYHGYYVSVSAICYNKRISMHCSHRKKANSKSGNSLGRGPVRVYSIRGLRQMVNLNFLVVHRRDCFLSVCTGLNKGLNGLGYFRTLIVSGRKY